MGNPIITDADKHDLRPCYSQDLKIFRPMLMIIYMKIIVNISLKLICKEKMWNIQNSQLSYYVNTGGFVYKSYKPNSVHYCECLKLHGLKNGLSTPK